MNSAGYSLIEKPIRAREKHYPLFYYILKKTIQRVNSLSGEALLCFRNTYSLESDIQLLNWETRYRI